MRRSCSKNAMHPHLTVPFSFPFPALNDIAGRLATVDRRSKFFLLVYVCLSVAALSGGVARAEPIATKTWADVDGPFAQFIAEAAKRFSIPASWVRAVMQVESAGNVRALSQKGAMGLMQIMPETWLFLRARYGFGADPFDPHDNIFAGAAYLQEMLDRFGSPGFLAAYNTGPDRYDEYLATGRPLPRDTQAYVAMLIPLIDGRAINGTGVVAVAAQSWTDAPLFTTQSNRNSESLDTLLERSSARSPSDDSARGLMLLASLSDRLFVATSIRNQHP